MPPAWTDEAAITTIPVESGAMTLSPDGSRIYIQTTTATATGLSRVSVINTATNARKCRRGQSRLGGVSAEAAVAVSPNGAISTPRAPTSTPPPKMSFRGEGHRHHHQPGISSDTLSGDATITNLAIDNGGTNLYVREIDATGNSSLTVIDLPLGP